MSEEFFLAELDQVLEQLALDVEFNTTDLCKKLAISRTSLHRKITIASGKSISIYVREFRLRKAYEQLQTTNQSVSSVAYNVGFSDLAYFSKCFKKLFGCSPSTLQKEKND